MEKKNIEKAVGKFLLSLGTGGFITLYVLNLCKIKLLPVSEKIWKIISDGDIPDINMDTLEPVIVWVSLFALLMAPLVSQLDRKMRIELFFLLLAVFINISGIYIVLISGEIPAFYVLCLWITATYTTWICIEKIKVIYCWVKRKV